MPTRVVLWPKLERYSRTSFELVPMGISFLSSTSRQRNGCAARVLRSPLNTNISAPSTSILINLGLACPSINVSGMMQLTSRLVLPAAFAWDIDDAPELPVPFTYKLIVPSVSEHAHW